MTGNTFRWLGGSDNNDAATLANWQVEQSGSFIPAGALPGTLDSVTLDNGGTLNDSSGDLPLTAIALAFAGSGGVLEVGNLTLGRQNGAGNIGIGAGTTGTVLVTGSVSDHIEISAAGAGATLDIAAGGTFDVQNAIFAEQGAVVNLTTTAGGTLLMDGGAVADGGTMDVAAAANGSGLFVVGGGGVMTLQSVGPGAGIVFADAAGTLILQQTGTVGSAMLGFQAGDAIDLTALNDATLRTIVVNGNFTTLTDGTSTVVLPLFDAGLTQGSFITTRDGSGHVLLRTTQVDANWLNGANGDWSTAGDWSTGSVPGSGNNVVIGNLTDTFQVTATNEAAHSVVLTAPNGTLSLAGNFTVGTAILDPVGAIAVQTGATVTAFGLTIGGGTLNMAGTAQMTLGGTVSLGSGEIDVTSGGTVTATALSVDGGSIMVDSASVLNVGTAGAGSAFGLVVDAGATATVDNGALTAPIDDSGAILFVGSSTIEAGTVAGAGTLQIAAGATLTVVDQTPWTTPIDFMGSGAALVLDAPTADTGLIGNFPGNTIDLPGVTYDMPDYVSPMTASYDNSTGVLDVGGSGSFSLMAALTLDPGLSLTVATRPDAGGGTEIIVPCYAAGTHLATPAGDAAVEALAAGDQVLALHDGGWVARTVRWVGRTTIDLARHPQPQKAAPIRIRAHAFAENVPARDLLVSPDHAIFVDGALMQAQALQNGANVAQEFPARITYFHVELDAHSVLCAEGLTAESYLDTGNRALFAGEVGVRAVHPDLAGTAAWDERACAKLLLGGARVAAAHAWLLLRAVERGWSATGDPGLRILADGREVLAFAAGGGMWRATLPAGTREVRLVSRSFVPAWFAEDDRRRLGVAVAALRIGGARVPRAAFGAGWHTPEPGWRWTDGDARLALPPRRRAATLTVRLAVTGARYWHAAVQGAIRAA